VLEITACEAGADELASLEVYNTVWPHDAVTIEALRPELARGMYEVDLEIYPDIPGFEDVTGESFEDWMAHQMQRPTDSPKATFIALAGEGSSASPNCP
jgi:hypothetical protein